MSHRRRQDFGPVVKLVDHTTYGDGPVSNFVMIPDRDSGRVLAPVVEVMTCPSPVDVSCAMS